LTAPPPHYEIEAKNRDALKKFLSEKKVGTMLPSLNSSIKIKEIDLVCDYVEYFYNL